MHYVAKKAFILMRVSNEGIPLCSICGDKYHRKQSQTWEEAIVEHFLEKHGDLYIFMLWVMRSEKND